jgi:hypothetical protein
VKPQTPSYISPVAGERREGAYTRRKKKFISDFGLLILINLKPETRQLKPRKDML